MRLRFLGGFAAAGYAADFIAGAVAFQLGGVKGLLIAAQLVNVLFLFASIWLGARWLVRSIRTRRAAPLGTYANSDSRPRVGGASRVPGATL